MWQTLIGDLS